MGDRVKRGDVLADGPATENGELALGANVLVAFMPWGGYNFEDAILVSERLIKDDMFTSIHIEEFELQVRDTKRGVEEITREIPNVGEDAVRNLDEDGIIRIGAQVQAGDILVGKVTPKGETDLSPEERLLRAIFGEKAGDVRDASLKAPPGMDGIVIDIKVFSRREKDETARSRRRRRSSSLRREARRKQVKRSSEPRDERPRRCSRTRSPCAAHRLDRERVMVAGRQEADDALPRQDRFRRQSTWGSRCRQGPQDERRSSGSSMEAAAVAMRRGRAGAARRRSTRVTRGDELPPGVVKLVKVYVAKKRKLSVGDKMAGRHGNKGVVAKILPEEDMPYLPDGTPVDIVLESARRALAYEHRPDPRDAPRVGGAEARAYKVGDAGLRRRHGRRDQGSAQGSGAAGGRQDRALRRPHRRAVRPAGHGGLHLHAEAVPPRRRQDPRPVHRPLLAGHPAAAGRQGPVRRPAIRRDGGLGAGGLRRRVHPPGAADGQVRRCGRAVADLRGDRQGRESARAGDPESFNVLVKELQSLGLDVAARR